MGYSLRSLFLDEAGAGVVGRQASRDGEHFFIISLYALYTTRFVLVGLILTLYSHSMLLLLCRRLKRSKSPPLGLSKKINPEILLDFIDREGETTHKKTPPYLICCY